MDAASAKPRINGSMLSKFMGQYVCLVGKNLGISSDGLSISVETSDGQKIGARFPQPFHDVLDPYVELLGKVENDCSLSIQRLVNYGADFDIGAYDETVRLMGSFPDLFPTATARGQGAVSMDY